MSNEPPMRRRPTGADAPDMPPLSIHLIGGAPTPSMNARALYRVLEGREPFPLWLSYRRRVNGLVEGKDLERIPTAPGTLSDWAITPEAAKEIGFTERNSVGSALRAKAMAAHAELRASTQATHRMAFRRLDHELRAAVGDALADLLSFDHDVDLPPPTTPKTN